MRHTPLIFLIVLAAADTALAQVCNGPMAWLCEEHQMFDAEPAPTQKFKGEPVPDKVPELTSAPARQQTADRPDQVPAGQRPCLSLKEVHGGWPKYRVVNGRHCWYASTPGAKRGGSQRDTKSGSVGRATSGDESPSGRMTAGECREQAMKLDAVEKRAFLRECLSNTR